MHFDGGGDAVDPHPADGRRQAPTPPHERQWRHPSEIGAQAWALSEPPLVLGRGLAAATTALSLVLSALLLFTMLPTHAGRALVRSTESADRLAGDDIARSLGAVAPPPASLDVAPPTTVEITVAEPAAPPLPTFQVQQRTDGQIVTAAVGSDPVAPVAVAIEDGALIITTAAAVNGRTEVSLLDADGVADIAHVLFVDEENGLAVLLPSRRSVLVGIEVAEAVLAGDRLEVPGHSDEPVVISPDGVDLGAPIVDDSHVDAVLDDLIDASGQPNEGDPVINQRGELVALYTQGDGGPTLVLADRITELRRALGALLRPTVWLGILVDEAPDGVLVVGALDPDGPAASSGVAVGDTIASVDEIAVGRAIDLAGALAVHHVGDRVELGVVHTDGTTATISVVLAAPPPRL
jgi:S1-C subfamily serine protease